MRARGKWERVSKQQEVEVDEAKATKLLQERDEAKKVKDYTTADAHASELRAMGESHDTHDVPHCELVMRDCVCVRTVCVCV